MKKKASILLFLILVSLIILNLFDLKIQVSQIESSIGSMSLSEIESSYGYELYNVYDLYKNKNYEVPKYTFYKQNGNCIINVSTELYTDSNNDYGKLEKTESVDLIIPIYTLPIIGIEILEMDALGLGL